jgi:mannose-6-phosphate isomerase-like protein (cupin superfamily)
VRVIDAASLPGRIVNDFGSHGFSVVPVGASVHGVMARLERDGRIGRHLAVEDQVLVVLTGHATVSGDNRESVEVGPGQLVVWRAGEEHETRTSGGLTALILEADGLADALT